MIKKTIRLLCIWGAALHMGVGSEIPLEQIQGLYTPFLPDNSDLSLVQGMIALRTDILKNIRLKGYYGPKNDKFICHYQITTPRPGHEPQEKTNCPQDNTTAIIQQLFPSAAGEFSVPSLTSDFFRANKAQLGKILIPFHEARQKKLPYDEAYKVLREAFGKLKINTSDAAALKKEWKIDNLDFLLDNYAKIFAGSLAEQDQYPEGIVETALLAFMWKLTDKREGFDVLMKDLQGKLAFPKDTPQNKVKQWQQTLSGNLSRTPKKYPEASTPHKNTPASPAKNTPPLWCPMMGGYVPLLPGTISKQIIL